MKTILTIVLTLCLLAVTASAIASPQAVTAPSLGAAASFSVLGFSEVTNTGSSSLSGDIGVWSGSLISGLDEMTVGGAVHITDGVAQQAQADAAAAVSVLTGQAATAPILGALDGLTLVSGVYDIGAGSLGGGALTLDGPGVFIFRASSSLTSAGSIVFTNGGNVEDVYWYVPTQANLVSGSFAGTIIAGTGIVFGSGVSLEGRALAIGGNVTMINNSIYGPWCASKRPTATSIPEETPAPEETPNPEEEAAVPTLGIPEESTGVLAPNTGHSGFVQTIIDYIKYLISLLLE